MRNHNVIGPQVRKLRYRHRWTQTKFATKLQHCGWTVSRATVAKIESRVRGVLDVQVLYLAEVLQVGVSELFRGPTSGADLSKVCSIERIFVSRVILLRTRNRCFPNPCNTRARN
jgi:Predicted transcriptional regulators